ncbi:ABC transporter substrate-binding protein, partial [Sorangium cellulosum]
SGVFLANELELFKKAGLTVELKPFSNPGDTLAALAAGQLDVGLTTLQNLAVLHGNSESDVVAIALVDSSNGADAVVAKESIATMADLKGKTVALTLGEVNHMLFLFGLEKSGVSPGDVKITSMSADDAGAAFVAGKVDAAVTWEPWITKATKNGGHVIFSSASMPDTITNSVAVQRSKLAAGGDAYTRLLGAIDQGVKTLRGEPDKAHPIIGKYLGASPEDVKGMLSGDKIYDLADNKQLFGAADKAGPA